MWCNQIFSLLSPVESEENKYKIENVIVCDNYELASQIARSSYGNGSIALDTTRVPINIGDLFYNNEFHNKETDAVIYPNPTEQERIVELENRNAMLEECILEMSELIYAEVE